MYRLQPRITMFTQIIVLTIVGHVHSAKTEYRNEDTCVTKSYISRRY